MVSGRSWKRWFSGRQQKMDWRRKRRTVKANRRIQSNAARNLCCGSGFSV